ncbi:unnamed protein product [Musa acuminata subsp. burmannicoides]
MHGRVRFTGRGTIVGLKMNSKIVYISEPNLIFGHSTICDPIDYGILDSVNAAPDELIDISEMHLQSHKGGSLCHQHVRLFMQTWKKLHQIKVKEEQDTRRRIK